MIVILIYRIVILPTYYLVWSGWDNSEERHTAMGWHSISVTVNVLKTPMRRWFTRFTKPHGGVAAKVARFTGKAPGPVSWSATHPKPSSRVFRIHYHRTGPFSWRRESSGSRIIEKRGSLSLGYQRHCHLGQEWLIIKLSSFYEK